MTNMLGNSSMKPIAAKASLHVKPSLCCIDCTANSFGHPLRFRHARYAAEVRKRVRFTWPEMRIHCNDVHTYVYIYIFIHIHFTYIAQNSLKFLGLGILSRCAKHCLDWRHESSGRQGLMNQTLQTSPRQDLKPFWTRQRLDNTQRLKNNCLDSSQCAPYRFAWVEVIRMFSSKCWCVDAAWWTGSASIWSFAWNLGRHDLPQPGAWTHGRDHCKARVNLDVFQQASERTCNHVAAFHATGNAGTCRQAPNDERCFTMPSYYHQTAAGFQLPRARARKEIYSGPSHPTILIL